MDLGEIRAARTSNLRRMEKTATNVESFMKPIPHENTLLKYQHLNLICLPPEDTLSDVDLENFDTIKKTPNECRLTNNIADRTETVSLSNFHNVGDALLYFSNRLESYLKTNSEENADDYTPVRNNCLKENISDLKRELERYVDMINERKENELRKFSENMMRHSKILQIQNAFSRQEKMKTNIYETLRSSHFKYAIADNESFANSFRFSRDQHYSQDRFPIEGCFDDSSYYSDCSSVESFTMLIREEQPEKLLNDAPHPIYYGRERISLIFRDPENVANQWKNVQNPNNDKSIRSLWSKRYSRWSRDSESFWGFTLDSHKNEILEIKLYEERRMR